MNGKKRVVATRRTVLSPWVTLTEQEVACGERRETFHALDQADYINVLALTPEAEVALVRQFRPALDRSTIELPGGLLDEGEAPEKCAVRELAEEVGLAADIEPLLLGELAADTGRLQNRLWAYFIPRTHWISDWQPEAEVEPLTMSRAQLFSSIEDGRFDHALHIAVIGLAVMKRLF